jgi:hypothetical protein
MASCFLHPSLFRLYSTDLAVKLARSLLLTGALGQLLFQKIYLRVGLTRSVSFKPFFLLLPVYIPSIQSQKGIVPGQMW